MKDFMDKAVKKKVEREKEKAARGGKTVESKTPETPRGDMKADKTEQDDDVLGLSDDEDMKTLGVSPAESSATDLKRKREEDGSLASPKKTRTEMPPAPPPPPPPPLSADDMPMDMEESSLTPLEDSVDPTSEGDTNGVVVNGRWKLTQDNLPSPMQLATPPTNGSCEHGGYANGDGNNKRLIAVNGGL